jgi:hypothetical protein
LTVLERIKLSNSLSIFQTKIKTLRKKKFREQNGYNSPSPYLNKEMDELEEN